jgi:hypothetical protein
MRFCYLCLIHFAPIATRVDSLLMKKLSILIILSIILAGTCQTYAGNLWQLLPSRPGITDQETNLPSGSLTFKGNDEAIRKLLFSVGTDFTDRQVELPMPDGTLRLFHIRNTPVLPPGLAARYPGLRTFTGIAADDPFVTAKIDYTAQGLHAMIYDGENTSLVDPVGSALYSAHYKRNELRQDGDQLPCATLPGIADVANQNAAQKTAARTSNGYELRRYRLALACSHQYAQAVTGSSAPSVAEVLSKMTTTINRVNGIYERELSVTMIFAEQEESIIFTVAAGDPYGPYNSSASTLLEVNQKMCDSLVGDANYDIGHAFTTGAGGLSQVGVVCKSSTKAQCVTGSVTPVGDGFDIDYVAHEMGHEYGADHTFNNGVSTACAGNGVASHAYEPGSGSTIMAYAGLCSPDNIQANSDAYFHATSLQQIQHYITHKGDECAVKTPTGNKQPGLPAYTATYTIPYRTPFELTAPLASDSTGDNGIFYCWEQWDLGGFGQTLTNATIAGPLFRSFAPVKSPVRTFPSMRLVRNSIQSNAGIDKASGEKTPTVARELNFKLTARNLRNGMGCFLLTDDSVHISVINTNSTGFAVTSQNTGGLTYVGYSSEQVTWNVAGTNSAPINAANVEIFLSSDTGNNWQYSLGTFPNTGSAMVELPNPEKNINNGRIKVKGAGNVFFNVNSKDFKLVRNFDAAIDLYPVPASNNLHIATDKTGVLQAAVYNMVGKLEWQGTINGQADLPVYLWAKGVYIMKLVDTTNQRTIKKFVVN